MRFQAAAVKGVVSEPRFEPMDVSAITRRVATMLAPQAEAKGIAVRVEPARDLPSATVDVRQVYRAVYNLLHNAIDACRKGDTVTLRCRAQVGGEFPGGNCLLIECADTGPGITEDVKTRLFTDEAVSMKPAETGLGTRIIKNVIDAHNGTLDLQSEVGVGTTILCRVPLAR